MLRSLFVMTTLALAIASTAAAPAPPWTLPLATTDGLRAHGVTFTAVTYQGQKAVRLVGEPGFDGEGYAAVKGPAIQDGRIELDVAGRPGAGAPEGARGFIGVAFRIQPDDRAFECFYIRPTNGRADDQLRRNHSTQYISFPDWPWERLRRESPGVYESYADLVVGDWTHLRIDVSGRRAQLYVNGASQPSLIVNDLKLQPASGGVGLWLGTATEGYFRNLRVAPSGS